MAEVYLSDLGISQPNTYFQRIESSNTL